MASPLALDEKNAPQTGRMTNGVPLALDDELQNRNDGKWYWRGTTNLFSGIELLHHTNGVIKLQLPFTNGLPHGHRIMWHPNGQKKARGVRGRPALRLVGNLVCKRGAGQERNVRKR